ncbi:sarcosine oxidase subunit beta family protein [Phenylobacterium sp.]|jgi:sarcosine oxidase subunit beta|uniref:sarcosine oxidase subunit beta family protein n=1 Tax=Phenylobacterium sp. TaxID=1871053 RepID=UPI0037C4F228
MRGYSALAIARNALSDHAHWPQAWRSPEPQTAYDAIIVGGGGHGLACAYYLAKEHGLRRVAVLEKGWLGGGNTGRNTTIIRSNYFYASSAAFYDFALRQYEGLSRELNFNIMFSPRGVLVLSHTRHDLEMNRRVANAMRLNGIDADLISRDEVKRLAPALDCSPTARFPVLGALIQRRAGTARHDAVAWAYARAADALGVDIIQSCEVTGFQIERGRVRGVETSRGPIQAPKVAIAVAGHSSVLAEKAGFRLPIISYALQAMVSEPLKPVLDTVVLSPATGAYLSQSDKGELVIGGGLDLYPSYAQRGGLPVNETTVAGMLSMFPSLSRVRQLRQWAGICDVSPDSSPILGKSPIEGIYLSTGWGTGGFKAIPAGGYCLAHTLARDEPHALNAAFGLDRFVRNALVDEAGAASIPH